MSFEIAHAEGFPFELGRAPKKVQNAYRGWVHQTLRDNPDQQDAPRIKKLNGYKMLWRCRVSDEYRLVYAVDRERQLVTMLMLGNRADIYERLGANQLGEPGTRIVALKPELLEREPSAEQMGQAIIELKQLPAAEPPSAVDRALPIELTQAILQEWSVPEQYAAAISAAKTESQLLALEVPGPVLERVMNGLWPRSIEEIVETPTRLSGEPELIEKAAVSEIPLDAFLLKLDDEQRAFVSRFEQRTPTGPWLLKGGPGSGKSTVALYCIRALLREASEQLPNTAAPLSILFTTFTKSLVNASQYLLKSLLPSGGPHRVHVMNTDKLVQSYLPQNLKALNVPKWDKWPTVLASALDECRKTDSAFAFTSSDSEFLYEEVDWVIFGQGLTAIEQYLEADRGGRGRRLGSQQRRHVWRLFESFHRKLREQHFGLFSEFAAEAARAVRPRFDYVFVDEAQDLTPAAIRFCIGLCKAPANVFLTADGNQSIYGTGLSWTRVATDLRFGGRARTLSKNYRTTKEIWQALRQIAPEGQDTDQDTLALGAVFSGLHPLFARYESWSQQVSRLNAFLFEAVRAERVGPGCAAVLCPFNKDVSVLAAQLDQRLNPKAMTSSEVDLAHPGVKVLTMHAVKGLQFPVVGVVGVENGRIPQAARGGADPHENNARQQRLLFVACSRAMRRLAVFGSRTRPSPFVSRLTDEYWEIDDL